MTGIQALWARLNGLFENPPPHVSSACRNNVAHQNEPIAFTFHLSCGGSINGEEFKCGRPDCKRCNPMTPERAAQINERFLKERGYE